MALFGRETEQERLRARNWAVWAQRQEPWAIASFVLGVFSLIEFGVLGVFGVAGIAFGVIALRRLARATVESSRTRGRGLAWAGIVASAVSLGIAAVLYLLPT
ncbi:MAG: DUF4190 domain-containing protein [Tepidisphaeraceae bacterium]